MGIAFDDVFETGNVGARLSAQAEKGSNTAKAIACACALSAWACCMRGSKPPEKFGWGMIALADWAGLSVADLQPENAKKVADKALAALSA